MGLTSKEKADLASYQLKDIAKTWYTLWRDNMPLIVGPINWEVFRRVFLNLFFPTEKRESNVEEFINLLLGVMSLQEYSLKFTKIVEVCSFPSV